MKVRNVTVMTKIRTVVLEDNPLANDRICKIVSDWDRGEIVGRHLLVKDALRQIEIEEFDLLIADLKLPDGSGVRVIEAATKTCPDALSIVISSLTEKRVVVEALQAGASGFINKDDPAIHILASIEQMLEGGAPISSGIARYLVDAMRKSPPKVVKCEDAPVLTPREQEVLNAIARGFTNREVAEILNLSRNTVPVHIRNIYSKLQTSNRTETTYEARRLGMLDG